MMSGSPMKPPAAPRWSSVKPGGVSDCGSIGSDVVVGNDRVVVDRLAVRVESVPQRERDAEEALARDEPVAVESGDPVVVAHLHVARVPVQLGAALEQPLAQQLVASTVADVPLPGGDDLERLVALLEELHRVLDRAWVADQVAALAQHLDDRLLRGEDRRPGQSRVGRAAVWCGDRVGSIGEHPPVASDDRPGRQVELAPPRDVGECHRTCRSSRCRCPSQGRPA